jgi:hypothetical protein
MKPSATFWFAVSGRGRYILSLRPIDGKPFQKAGAIRDHVISWNVGGERYELRMQKPIVEEGGAYNLYVLHEPAYRHKHEGLFGGVDRMDNLLPKRQ